MEYICVEPRLKLCFVVYCYQRSDTMINFQKLNPNDAALYRNYLRHATHRGCAFDFANLFMWGRQCAAFVDDHLLFFSHFNGHTLYPFPIGPSDPKQSLDAIISDAHERGIPCRITGLTEKEKAVLEEYYPGQFRFYFDRDSFDYVYDINDLADLKGRRYQQKRNHLHRFEDACPDFYTRPLDEATLPACRNMTDNWYRQRAMDNPHEDLQMEQNALRRAYSHYDALGMEGLVLYAGGQIVAMTMGSFLNEDTVDVHFEKAVTDIPGAYAAINREFARHIRSKYPHVKFLNREDDTGSAGLRKAKLSYHPHHMVEKSWALLNSEEYDD